MPSGVPGLPPKPFASPVRQAPNGPFHIPAFPRGRAIMHVSVAGHGCLTATPNSKAIAAGPAFRVPPAGSTNIATPATARSAPNCAVMAATRIRDMSFQTGRRRPDCAIASMGSRCASSPPPDPPTPPPGGLFGSRARISWPARPRPARVRHCPSAAGSGPDWRPRYRSGGATAPPHAPAPSRSVRYWRPCRPRQS
mgnify:CR=1 FL=1